MSQIFRFFDFPAHFWLFWLMQHRKGFQSVKHMRRYLRRLVIWGAVLGVALTLLLAISDNTANMSYESLLTVVFLLGSALLWINVYTSFVAEFVVLWQSHAIISDDVLADRLDLLRLGVGEHAIIHVKHAFAQVRSWRIVSLWVAGRILSIFFLGLASVLAVLAPSLRAEVDLNGALLLLLLICGLFMLAFASVFFPLELIWRWRLVCAVGVFASARNTSRMSGLLTAILMLMGVSLMMSTILFIVSIPFSIGFSGLIWLDGGSNGSNTTFLLFLFVLMPLLLVFFVWGLYWSYGVMTRWLLNNTERYLLRL